MHEFTHRYCIAGYFCGCKFSVESWRWPLELIFLVLNFVATSEYARMRSQIIETSTIVMNPDHVCVDVGPWSVSLSSLV